MEKEMSSQSYKQTDVGIIPEDWDLISYDAAFNFLSTATYSRADLSTDNEILYVHYGDIHTKLNDFLDLDSFPLPSIDVKKAKKYSHLQEGDLLMADASEDYEGICKSVEVKNVGDKKAISGLHTFLLRDKKKVFADGFRGYIRSNRSVKTQLERLATGLKVYGVSKTNLKLVMIPLPPLPEQQAIAEVLSDVDALINSLDQLITKKRNIKQGTMQLLLTGKKRLAGFAKYTDAERKQSEFGSIPSDWHLKNFEDVISGFSSGSTPSRAKPEYYTGKINWITSGELNYNIISDTIEKITKEAVINTNLKILPKGTFLMAITGLEAEGTRGSCGIIGEKATTNQLCMALFPSNQLLPEYLFHFYVMFGDYLALHYCQGTKQQSYTGKIVKILPIILPPTIEEQKAIAQTLSDLDAEIEALEQKRDKYKAVKQGMMQELLTGKIRLKINF